MSKTTTEVVDKIFCHRVNEEVELIEERVYLEEPATDGGGRP